MYYVETMEGYPALLKTRTSSKMLSETYLTQRRTPWVYLTRNPQGRWQVLAPDGNGDVICVAGASTPAQVLPVMVETARKLGIFDKRTRAVRSALFLLGYFVMYESKFK